MFYREHGTPHFHAFYGGYRITVEIETGIVNGRFPTRAQSHVLEWWQIHKAELLEDWRLASERKPMNKIDPLE
jgi:hypothetical protein